MAFCWARLRLYVTTACFVCVSRTRDVTGCVGFGDEIVIDRSPSAAETLEVVKGHVVWHGHLSQAEKRAVLDGHVAVCGRAGTDLHDVCNRPSDAEAASIAETIN